ncbi:hypothetical protein L202_05965 [Cryptococcus amylolentus CBS 6039]|uniref:Proteasome assembly chaperone 2 n=1 Tax=Cryptococcus amylolentus CBS 6039 TaxID=1295533 RepID=A0A1E3HIP3_9TREE|nr:hypothetical protein L202_05965 [Cryptococcus amylolentus CBS 6039]ODN76005.1 hypothetical protein L202_05965 [Cryptococcus amylolentus CBS 6039]
MTVFHPSSGFNPKSFSSATLIIPAVSLGNVPQLTADLLISTLGLKRVGFLGNGDTVAPFAGVGENGEVATGGLEVYGQEGSELYVVQQRSPTLKTKKDEHVSVISEFAQGNEFGFVLVVTSLDSAHQDDVQLLTPYQHILPPTIVSSVPPIIQRIKNLPPLSLAISQPSFGPRSTSRYPPFLPAAGLTRRLLSAFSEDQKKISHGAVTAWCVEGDNRGDARGLAGIVLGVLGIANDVDIREPASWEGLFGTTDGWSGGFGADAELYG